MLPGSLFQGNQGESIVSAGEREGSSTRARQAVGEMIEVQRRIFTRQKRLVDAGETHRKKGFVRYRSEYRKAVSGFIAESGLGALCDDIAKARIVYVSDYHTLQLAQKTLVKLIRAAMQQVDNLCLAVEFVDRKYQEDLDKFLAGKIRESTFLRRIHYREQWPYDIWPNFKPLFDLAIEEGFPMVAIDSASTFSLTRRDNNAAACIAHAAAIYPEATIFVSAGQMHMAPAHLPKKVDHAFQKEGLDAPERVIVYQNAEEIYWKLATEGREEVDVVQVGADAYCINNTPPLVQQLSYLHWIQFDEELIEYTQLEETVRVLIKDLARYLAFDIGRADEHVRVLMPADLDLMETLRETPMSREERRQVIRQVESGESLCIPDLDLIYLANLSVNHAAEEAAHYLKHIVSGGAGPERLMDQFYFIVLNEACAFFCSKVVNPKRKAHHAGRLRSLVAQSRDKKSTDTEDLAARFALEHLSWQQGGKRRKIGTKAFSVLSDRAVFNAAAHFLGYILGDRLYYGLTDGVVAKDSVRDLFLAPLDGEKEAFGRYMDLVQEVHAVKIPRRI